MIIGKASEVPVGKAKKFVVNGKELAVFNIAGTLHTISNECAHLGGPLCEGLIQGQNVTCPWHDWTYDVTTGKEIYNEGEVPSFKTRVDGDDIVVEGL